MIGGFLLYLTFWEVKSVINYTLSICCQILIRPHLSNSLKLLKLKDIPDTHLQVKILGGTHVWSKCNLQFLKKIVTENKTEHSIIASQASFLITMFLILTIFYHNNDKI